jgi:hypothetical protein
MEEEKNSPTQLLDKQHTSNLHTQCQFEREVRKQLLVDTLQDRKFLILLAICVSALLFSWLFAPSLGGYFYGQGIALLAGLAAFEVFLWRYVICYKQNYALKSRELLALSEAQKLYLEEQRLAENGKLEAGFSEVNAADGLTVLRALDREYRLLRLALSGGKEMDLHSASALEAKVYETYFRGLSILQDVLELERAFSATDQARLQSEIDELQKKAAAAGEDPAQRDRVGNINERIASNQERIRIVNDLKKRLEQLVYQAKHCEASLGKTRIELAALKADASGGNLNTVIDTLQKTIDQAREVQEEVKGIGFLKEGE